MLIFGLVAKLQSQIVASATAGCAPLSVLFSGPAGATNVLWNLGTGIGTSTLATPNPVYNSAGVYNVTFSGIVNGSPVNYSKQITVYASPTGNFSYILPGSHCAPMTVTFSANGGNAGSTYNYSYGDLTSSPGMGNTMVHTYNFVGNYFPGVVIVDGSTGCTGTASPMSSPSVVVSASPNVVISSSQGFMGCNPPFSTNLTGSLSSGSSNALPLSFNWNIGGGSPGSSNLPTPGAVSFGAGQNTVTLMITDNNSCSNSASVVVTVSTPSLSVLASPSVCSNSGITLTVNATHSPVNWISSTGPSPTTSSILPSGVSSTMAVGAYTNGGFKTYTVSIYPGGVCPPVVTTGTIFVENVIASYTTISTVTPPVVLCTSPGTFNLVNTSSVNNGSSLSFIWSTSPGTSTWPYNAIAPTSTASTNPSLSPTFTMTQNSLNPYTCYDQFSPGVLLTATSNSPLQCSAASTIWWGMYNLWRPSAWFNKSKQEGCAPLSINIRDSSSNCSNPSNPITGYTMYLGGSPPTTSVGTTPNFTLNHVFTNPGTYPVYLQITTSLGCVSNSYTDIITVASQPTLSGSVALSSVCAGVPVTINMNGTVNTVGTSSTVNHWHVTTDNGYFSGCVTNANPSYPFTHTGTHTIGVTGYQSGCSSGVTVLPQTITVKGPFGQTRFETTCTGNRKSVNFYTYLQDVQSAVLNFGDNTSASLLGAPGSTAYLTSTHTYSASGNYTVSLVSTGPAANGCGPRTFTTVVKIRQPDANIIFNGIAIPTLPAAMACVTDTYNFTASTSIDVAANCRTGYVWNLKTPTYTMPTFENSLPELKYSASQILYFHTNPPPTPGLPPPFTIFDTISHDRFLTAGIYTISLTVRDDNECTDTETKTFRISSAAPEFTFNANPVCLSAGSVQVINNTQGIQIFPDVITGYTINFGDGLASLSNTNAAWSPTYGYQYAFPPSQVFNVTMTGSNNLGCIGATTRTLQVNNPVPGLHPVNPADYFPCLKKGSTSTVNFTANPGYLTYTVNFGDPPGTSPSQTMTVFSNVPHVYSQPGTYMASLTVVDNGACKATEVKTITVIGQATASIHFLNDLNKFCVNDVLIANSNTSLFVTPMTNTLWTFTGLQSNTNIVTQNLPNVGAYQISLNVTWNGYCPSSDTQMVYVSDPKAKLELDKNIFCLGDEIHVRIKDTSSVGVWQWAFGDNVPQTPVVVGTFSANFVPNPYPYTYNIYPNNGQEGKTLLTLFYYGMGQTCKRQDTISLFVIKVDSDFDQSDHLYKHCAGLGDEFLANFVNPYKLPLKFDWDFAGTKKTGGPKASHTFTQSGIVPITLTVTNTDYGCKSVSVKNMTILPLPKAFLHIGDTICPNDTFAISGSGTAGFGSSVKGVLKYTTHQDSVKFNSQNTFTTLGTASITTTYSLSIVDDNGCKSEAAVDSVYVRAKPNIMHWDTTVIIGEQVPINAYIDKNYTYTWSPVFQGLSCVNCYNPISSTTVSLTYTLIAEDSPLVCYTTYHTFTVNINPKTSIDVPSAFTPNGDGINDVVYVGGWGIRKLNYFKIFNRWGQLLFQSNDVKVGWDGKFEGIPQNMETYVYEVSVETYLDTTLSKSGTIKILR